MDLYQFRSQHELGANRPVVLVWASSFRIDPGEASAHGGVMRLRVDSAHVVAEEDAPPRPYPGSPLAPPGAVDESIPMHAGDGGGFIVTQGDAVGATGRAMGTGKARQRW